MADVGTKLNVSSTLGFCQYSSALNPYSEKANLTFAVLSLNSFIVWIDCTSKESLVFLYYSLFHSKHRSILFKAIINGHFFCLSNSIDSNVCCSKPCMRSTTRIAKSQREEPLDLKLVNDSWPGVSITKNPGNCKSMSILPFTFSIWPST